MCAERRVGHIIPLLLPLACTPEAPVVYDANKFSRIIIKKTHGPIDWQNDIIFFSTLSFIFHTEEMGDEGGGDACYTREILFQEGAFPPVSPLTQPHTVPMHAHPPGRCGDFCSGREVSTLVFKKPSRQSIRQLH